MVGWDFFKPALVLSLVTERLLMVGWDFFKPALVLSLFRDGKVVDGGMGFLQTSTNSEFV